MRNLHISSLLTCAVRICTIQAFGRYRDITVRLACERAHMWLTVKESELGKLDAQLQQLPLG